MNWEGKNDKKLLYLIDKYVHFFLDGRQWFSWTKDFWTQVHFVLMNRVAMHIWSIYIYIHKLNMIRSRTVSCRINGHGASILIGRAAAEQPFQVMFNTYKCQMCRWKIMPSMLNFLSWLNHFNIFNHPQLMTMSNLCWIPKQFAAPVLRPWPMGCASSGSNNWSI